MPVYWDLVSSCTGAVHWYHGQGPIRSLPSRNLLQNHCRDLHSLHQCGWYWVHLWGAQDRQESGPVATSQSGMVLSLVTAKSGEQPTSNNALQYIKIICFCRMLRIPQWMVECMARMIRSLSLTMLLSDVKPRLVSRSVTPTRCLVTFCSQWRLYRQREPDNYRTSLRWNLSGLRSWTTAMSTPQSPSLQPRCRYASLLILHWNVR